MIKLLEEHGLDVIQANDAKYYVADKANKPNVEAPLRPDSLATRSAIMPNVGATLVSGSSKVDFFNATGKYRRATFFWRFMLNLHL